MSPLDIAGVDPFAEPDILIPRRTRLHTLPPSRIETPMRESLLSFVVRTARAHAVNPRRLIASVFPEVVPAFADLAYATFFTKLAGTANGLGRYAELFVTAMEHLTGRHDLKHLTMLPWRELFPHNGQGLLTRHPRWCPACFAEQLLAGSDPVAPLAWSLEAVRVCPSHRLPLQEQCPTCGRRQPFIPRYPDISVCEHCHYTLAANNEPLTAQKQEALSALELWAVDAVGDMLMQPTDIKPNAERFRETLLKQISVTADGNRARFCREMGLREWALKGWLTKNERPSLTQFLAVCYGLGCMPTQLFVRTTDAPHTLRLIGDVLKRRTPRPKLTDNRREELKHCLLERLSAREASSIAAAGRELGVPARFLRYWFPDLCQSISLKHRKSVKTCSAALREKQRLRVEEVVREVCEGGEYPSRRRINRALRQERMALVLPHLLDAYLAAIKECCIP